MIEKVNIEECKEGDILADDVLNDQGIILVARDTILNDYIILKLKALKVNILSVYRYEEDSDQAEANFLKTYQENLFHVKEMLEDLARGNNLDYQIVNRITKSIYQSIKDCGSIVKYLLTLKNADEYSYTHSLNTALYAMMISTWLGLSEIEIEQSIQAGLLHDIGKSLIPNEILNKKGRLNEEEFEIIKKHTIYGYHMLDDAKEICSEIKKAVLYHHERMDGSGYPYRISLKEVNIYSRIIAVADVFDAMTSDRVYKKRVTPFDAFEMFLTNGMGIFDPKIIRTFTKKMANHFVGTKTKLSNEEEGEIVFIPPYDVLSPIILTQSGYIDLSKDESLKIISIL